MARRSTRFPTGNRRLLYSCVTAALALGNIVFCFLPAHGDQPPLVEGEAPEEPVSIMAGEPSFAVVLLLRSLPFIIFYRLFSWPCSE